MFLIRCGRPEKTTPARCRFRIWLLPPLRFDVSEFCRVIATKCV